MKKQEFIENIERMLQLYADNVNVFDSNPQLRVNPRTLDATIVNGSDMMTEIEDSDEAVENAAAALGAENMDATDYQASQNPDFYAATKLLTVNDKGRRVPDEKAVMAVADVYSFE